MTALPLPLSSTTETRTQVITAKRLQQHKVSDQNRAGEPRILNMLAKWLTTKLSALETGYKNGDENFIMILLINRG